ncbi:uncharacterized protein LOC116765460 [Danaus plexippus]|uniref:uncharacterized protein LOC116765460 n=1 Tax=Danaus plexippus TaxID=13037 RepID=UPI002AB10FB5|nr:uncharacterized protein LOC116765460 [Danaus plexippus]
MYFKGCLFVLGCMIASSIAGVIPILAQSEEFQNNGSYKFSYETGNGIVREEVAYGKILPRSRDASSNEGGESNESEEIHVQRGSYSYTAPDGTVISVRYIADENGFQPIYEHIPSKDSSNSAEKSGRALKLYASESKSAPIPKISVSESSERSVDEIKPQEKIAPEIVPLDVSTVAPSLVSEVTNAAIQKENPEVVPMSISTVASQSASAVTSKSLSENVPNEISTVEPEISSSSSIISEDTSEMVAEISSTSVPEEASTIISQTESESDFNKVPTAIPENASTVISEQVSAGSTEEENLLVSTESVQAVTELKAIEESESTTANVDVSTIPASTAGPDQPLTETEQGTIASAELPSSDAPEQLASSEVSESSNSTSAPEQASTTEAVRQEAS